MLEINQAGLSWLTILRKRETLRRAYDAFDVGRVAGFAETERARLLADPGVIRHRLKVDAAIHNAGAVLEMRRTAGSFAAWLDAHHPRTPEGWTRVFRSVFRFTGGEITRSFLIATGYLPGAHDPACPVYAEVLRRRPAWSTAGDTPRG